MRRVDICQNTPEWIAWRASGIGGSDASKVIGVNPWCTPYQLYLEKTGRAEGPKMNPAMQRGVDLEPHARRAYEEFTGNTMPPKCYEDGIHLASLDGINFSGDLILEIKCPGEAAHLKALQGEIPDYYMAQMQHCMMVTGAKQCHFWSYRPECEGSEQALIVVDRDDDYIAKLRHAEIEFWECVVNDTPPEIGESDYVVNNDPNAEMWTCRYFELLAQEKALKTQIEEAKQHILDHTDDGNMIIGKAKITKVNRKGSVDYKKLCADAGIQDHYLEQFRKPDTFYWKITELSNE